MEIIDVTSIWLWKASNQFPIMADAHFQARIPVGRSAPSVVAAIGLTSNNISTLDDVLDIMIPKDISIECHMNYEG